MGDLISRQAAIDAICTEGTRLERNGTVAMAEIKQWCVDILDALPSVQPERKKGKWVRNFDGNEWYWYCLNCKEKWYEEDLLMGGNDFPNYCPNCGSYNGGEQK